MMPKLRIRSLSFSEGELRAWKKGNYSLVKDCCRPLRRILRRKARARPGRRFFGEAKVASTVPHADGWYGSFKWLTSPKWSGNRELGDRYQARFRAALLRHFPDLGEFQRAIRASMTSRRGRRPVGPDLWLTTARAHRFIEVKLPGDRVARHQLQGLALIRMLLRSDRPVSVELVQLHNGPKPKANQSERFKREFRSICRQLRSVQVPGGDPAMRSGRR